MAVLKKSLDILLPEDIYQRLLKEAEKKGLKKSVMAIYAISFYLDYAESLSLMPSMLEELKRQDIKKD